MLAESDYWGTALLLGIMLLVSVSSLLQLYCIIPRHWWPWWRKNQEPTTPDSDPTEIS